MKAILEKFDEDTCTFNTEEFEVDSLMDLKESIHFFNSGPFRNCCSIKCEKLGINQSVHSFMCR